MPEHSNITIHTDSAAAIQLINKCSQELSTKKWLKTANNLWLLYINALIKEKCLNVELVKIIGHSGNVYNDLADELAKNEGLCDFILDVPFISTNDKLKFFPCYNNISLSQKIRCFSSSLLRLFTCAK